MQLCKVGCANLFVLNVYSAKSPESCVGISVNLHLSSPEQIHSSTLNSSTLVKELSVFKMKLLDPCVPYYV